MSTERFQQLMDWLIALPEFQYSEFSVPEPASSDASFRRYFRTFLKTPDGERSFIIMDAPPEHEDCRPFIRLSAQLDAMGLQVPQVLAQDLAQGFLLLTDLGKTTYLSVLDENSVDGLYRDALQALAQMQQQGQAKANALPLYSDSLLTNEMALFSDWLMAEHLDLRFSVGQLQQWQACQQALIRSAQQQPQVYVHRDYHSRNLMVLEQNGPGILDFQDAVKGPLTYDAVSLLRDCYIQWDAERVKEWQRESFLLTVANGLVAKQDWTEFRRAMDLMGIQRHLKAAGIFARLFHRDGKDGYLADIPPTLRYIAEVGKSYSEMTFLVDWVENQMLANWHCR